MSCVAVLPLGLALACASGPTPTSSAATSATDAPTTGSTATPNPKAQSQGPATSPTGAWDDQDSDVIAEALAMMALKAPWVDEWTHAKGKRPVVRVHPIRNRTVNYIDYRYLTKQIEHAFVNSGRVDVVTSIDEAATIREDRSDQAEHASDESAKSQGQELGSDFVLTGMIMSEDVDSPSGRARVYLASVEIVETESGRKAWIGQKKLSKPLPK